MATKSFTESVNTKAQNAGAGARAETENEGAHVDEIPCQILAMNADGLFKIVLFNSNGEQSHVYDNVRAIGSTDIDLHVGDRAWAYWPKREEWPVIKLPQVTVDSFSAFQSPFEYYAALLEE